MPFPFPYSNSQRYKEAAWWNKFIDAKRCFIRWHFELTSTPLLSPSNKMYIHIHKREWLHDMTVCLITYDRVCTGRSLIGKGEYNA